MSLAWLYELERSYEQRSGKHTWSFSDWHNDPHDVVLPTAMLSRLTVDPFTASRYRFADTVGELKSEIARFYASRHSIQIDETKLAIAHNGTAALHLIVRSLAATGIERVLVVTPAYFSVFEVLKLYKLTAIYYHTEITQHEPTDIDQILRIAREQAVQAIFVTNPIFCVGRALNPTALSRLAQYAESSGTWLIVDESLGGLQWTRGIDRPFVTPFMRIAQSCSRVVHLWAISKSLFLNGLKHALITAPEFLIQEIEKGADFVVGGLLAHQLVAIKNIYSVDSESEILECVRCNVNRFVQTYDLCSTAIVGSQLKLTPVEIGFHSIVYTLSTRGDPTDLARSIASDLVLHQGISAMPLAHFGFPPFSPLGFRVNLSKNPGKLCEALIALSKVVDEHSHLSN